MVFRAAAICVHSPLSVTQMLNLNSTSSAGDPTAAEATFNQSGTRATGLISTSTQAAPLVRERRLCFLVSPRLITPSFSQGQGHAVFV